jgi:polar amino acid transport system substrate-binding protein
MEMIKKAASQASLPRQHLKRGLAGLLLALSVLGFPLPALAIDPNQGTETIRVGVEVNVPPYSYVDDNGMIKGFNVDLVRAVAIEMGVDIELYAQTPSDLSKNLLNHGLDAVISSHFEDSGFSASRNLIALEDAIFVRADNQFITDLEGFWNSPVAVNTQSLTTMISTYLEKYGTESPKIVQDQEHGFLLLMNGDVDSYIGNKAAGMYLVQKWDQEEYIKAVGEPFNISAYKFYTSPTDKELLTRLDAGLEAVSENNSFEKVYEKWFGESAASYDKKFRKLLLAVCGVSLIALIIMILAMKWRKTLKSLVERRTEELNQVNAALLEQQSILKDKDQFKEDILNSVPTGIIAFDDQGRITSMNTRACDVLSIKDCDAEPGIQGLDAIPFLDRDKFEDVLENGSCYADLEGDLISGSDTSTLVYQLYPMRNGLGQSCGAIVNFKDISKERRLEEEMTRFDKMKSLDLLVSEFVHEIRTPLTSIKAMVELMPGKINNPNFRRSMMEIVTMEVDRLGSLVKSLSDYAKPMQNNLRFFDPKEVLDNVILLLQRKFEERNIVLETGFAAGLKVYGDPMQLMQVLLNLVLNSLESLQDQGVIAISTRHVSEDSAEITVSDNGPGISEENLPKITEPFFTTRQKGTGLGLYICRKLLEKNHGAMTIQSTLGQGTCITIRLPKHPMP